MVRYWIRIFILAGRRAWDLLGVRGHAVIFGTIATIAVIIALIYFGSPDAYKNAIISRLTLVLVPLLAYPFIYIWYLLRTPSDLNLQLEKEKSELASQLAKHNEGQTISWCLSRLIEAGSNAMQMRIKEDEFVDWDEKVKAWATRALKFLSNRISHQDAVNFQTVVFQEKRYVYAVNKDHNNNLNELSARLSILHEINQRYKDHWRIMSPQQMKSIDSYLDSFDRY